VIIVGVSIVDDTRTWYRLLPDTASIGWVM